MQAVIRRCQCQSISLPSPSLALSLLLHHLLLKATLYLTLLSLHCLSRALSSISCLAFYPRCSSFTMHNCYNAPCPLYIIFLIMTYFAPDFIAEMLLLHLALTGTAQLQRSSSSFFLVVTLAHFTLHPHIACLPSVSASVLCSPVSFLRQHCTVFGST